MARILVVDDEKGITNIIKSLLSKEGHEVQIANEGTEAIKKIEAVNPDLVILDVMMPGMNGYEVCAEIRRSASYNNLPVLMISGNNEPERELGTSEMEPTEYLSKPFDNAVLLTRIRELLKRSE